MRLSHTGFTGADGLSIVASGSVGIGDASPSYQLDVNGTGRFTGALTASSFSGNGASISALNALNISSGTVATARLGTGTASSSTFLRGDNTWVTPPDAQGVTSITVGDGLQTTGGATPNITLDLDEVNNSGTLIAGDKLVTVDGTATTKTVISGIPLSIFNNDSGWTSNVGDITSVGAALGLSGGGTSGSVSLALDLNELSSANIPIGTDKFIFVDASEAVKSAAYTIDDVPLSIFNNDSGWTSNAGTVTGSGTNNYIASWNGTTALEVANIYKHAYGTIINSNYLTSYATNRYVFEVSGNPGTGAFDGGIINLRATSDTNDEKVGRVAFINAGNANHVNPNAAAGSKIAEILSTIVTTDSNAGDDSGGDLQFWTKPEAGAPAERMRISSAGLFGIGTDPIANCRLRISGENYPLRVNAGSTEYFFAANILYFNSSSYAYIVNQSASLMLGAHNAEVMRLSSGKVGIGTTAPTQLLNVYQVGNSGNSYFEGAAKIGGNGAALGAFIGYNASASGYVNITNLNNSGGANSRIQFGFGAAIDGTPATQVMTLNQSGNVGIGEATPDMRLHVTNTLNTAYSVANVVVEANNLFKLENASTTANAFAGMQFRIGSGCDMFFGAEQKSGNDGDFYFANQGSPSTEIMRIKSTGYVGIGTNAPNARLEVHSDGSIAQGAEIRLQHANNNTTDVVSTINFANSIGSVAMIQAGTTLANNNGYISFFTDNAGTSSEKIRLISDGNVGIGTTAPGSLLHVYGGNIKISSTDDKPQLVFGEAAADRWVIGNSNAPNNHFVVGEGSDIALNERLVIAPTTGSVGIGTTSPSKLLEVNGPIRATNSTSGGKSYFYMGAVKPLETYEYDLGGMSAIYTSSGWNSAIVALLGPALNGYSAPAEYMTFSSDGTNRVTSWAYSTTHRVGVGTGAPKGYLEVYRRASTVPGLLLDSERDGGRINFNYAANETTLGEIGMVYSNATGAMTLWIGANLDSNTSSHTSATQGHSGSPSWYSLYSSAADNYSILRTPAGGSAATEFIINGDGNVGIGTAGPGNRLSVFNTTASDNKVIAHFEGQGIGGSTDAGGQYISVHRTGPISQANGVMGGIVFGRNVPTGSCCTIRSNYKYTAGRDSEFLTSSDNTSDPVMRMTIEGSGNVGIGTATPKATLQAQGGAGFAGSVGSTSTLNTQNLKRDIPANIFAYGLNMDLNGSPDGTFTADGKFQLADSHNVWNEGIKGSATYARVADRVLEFTVDTANSGSSVGQADHTMIGWVGAGTFGSYGIMPHAWYVDKGSGGAYYLNVYEDGNFRSTVLTATWGDVIVFRIILKATGADYYYKRNNGNWILGYVGTYSTESSLSAGMAIHSGRFLIHSMQVYDEERTISLDGGNVGIGTDCASQQIGRSWKNHRAFFIN